jgi:hypothetical protein
MKKNTFKKILGLCLTIILCVSICAVIGRTTNGFTNSVTESMINKDNLVHTLEEYESNAGTFANGLTWKINSNDSITVSGTYSENNEAAYEFVLGTVTVEKEDYYTLSGASRGSESTYYIQATYENASGNTVTLVSDFSDTMTTPDKLTEGTVVTLKIIVNPGCSFTYHTFKPTFVAGTEVGAF